MQSVEQLVQQAQIVQKSKESLRLDIVFEKYQNDFLFDEYVLKKNVILDVGTGEGDFVHYLQKVYANHHAYGIDFNQNAVDQKCPYLTVGNIQALPYPDNVFDTTISRNVLHGIFLSDTSDSITKALSELMRVTKEGGTLTYAIKSPEYIRTAIIKDIEDQESRNNLLLKLKQGIETEAQYFEYIQSLGNKVSVVFRGPRRIVKIEKRKVQ